MAAARRKLAVAEASRLIGFPEDDPDAAQHLLHSLKAATALMRTYGLLSAELDDQGQLVNQTIHGPRLHPFPAEYRRAIETHSRIAKLCLDAGIAERQMRLAEREAELVASLIRGVLDDLGIKDGPKVRKIVRDRLTALHLAA